MRRGDLDGWILAIFIVLKLGYEQFNGALAVQRQQCAGGA